MKRVLIFQRPGRPRSHFENPCSIFCFLVNINILSFFVFSRQPLQSKPHHSSEHIKLVHAQQPPKLTSVLSALRKGTVGLCSRNPAEPLWVVPPHHSCCIILCEGRGQTSTGFLATSGALLSEDSFSTWPSRSGPLFSSPHSLLPHCHYALHPR